MNILDKIFFKISITITIFLFSIKSSLAQLVELENGQIPTDEIKISSNLGAIGSIQDVFSFFINIMRIFGWFGVIFGVVVTLFALIYKLIGAPSEEAQVAVQGAITKAVIIVFAGILLLSIGFIINQVGNLFGLQLVINDIL